MLAPAACYPVYPIAAARGPVPDDGLLFDVACDCFRREPSRDIDRFQSFRMREFVIIGSAGRRHGVSLQLDGARRRDRRRASPAATIETASDPFFGRGGKLMGRAQAEQSLKFELLIPVRSAECPTACMSFNYHRDHFGVTWNMRTLDGAPAHTACVAFGIDRLAVALFATHGLASADWPQSLRTALAL